MHPADAGALTTGQGNAYVMPRKLNWFQRLTTSKVQPAEVDEPLADGVLPFDSDWQVHHTPGHTAGQCCLFNPVQKVLITGDAVMRFLGRLRRPFKMATVDMAQNMQGLEKLSQLDFDTVLFGHGPPIQGDAQEILRDWLSASG
jgi:glyoxylase-like metal-dependent hydrolase (beta-lactamase superfamily II)